MLRGDLAASCPPLTVPGLLAADMRATPRQAGDSESGAGV
jgi:hypothetical protein